MVIKPTLKDSELRYRRLFETAQDGILILDANTGMIEDVNPYLIKMLGYSHQEFAKKKLWEVGAFKDVEASKSAFEALQQNAYIRYDDLPLKTKDGRLIQVEFVSNVYFVGNKKVIQCNIRNISKRKLVETSLHNAYDFLQSVQDSVSAHIAILDDKGNIVQVNLAWRNFGAGHKLNHPNHCIGMNYLKVCDLALGLRTEQAASVASAIRDVIAGEEIEKSIEYPCHNANQQGWYVAHVSGFQNNGKRWVMVAHENVTERKQAEMEIRQRLSELEVLYQSGLAFSQLLNPKSICQKVIDLLDQTMEWHHTAIRLYDAKNETLELIAFNLSSLLSAEERSAVEKQFKLITRPDQGLSGWAIQHAKAILTNDLKNNRHYLEIFPGLRSGLYVPIKIARRVVGVISIESEKHNAFTQADKKFAITLAMQAAIAIDNAQLIENLKQSNHNLASAYDATIEGWSRALDLRDKETEGHSMRVTKMTLKLARTFGFSKTELVQVRWGALLHDIGKMGVPDGILLKPGKLTDEEWVAMKKHPTLAYQMLLPIQYLRQALDIPYCHHEKWDGSGYPRGLKGNQIPLVARIFAVVDVWDALRSDRPYRAGWTDEKVIEHIQRSSGTHFDPGVVNAFMKIPG